MEFGSYFFGWLYSDEYRTDPVELLADCLFDVRNEVLFEGFPEHPITRRMDPAHRAVYTALAKYVIENFTRNN